MKNLSQTTKTPGKFSRKLVTSISFLVMTAFLPAFAQPTQTEGYFPGADGNGLYYRVVGEGPETAVWLHGGPGFDQNDGGYDIHGLAEGRRLIIYDQRGTGKSELVNDPSRLTYEHHVEDLERLRHYFGIDKLNLMGHSWGVGLSVLYAMEYPENIDKLVFVAPMPIRDPMWGYRLQQQFVLIGDELLGRFGELATLDQYALTDNEVFDVCEEMIDIVMIPYLSGISTLDDMQGNFCEGPVETLRRRWWNNAATWGSIAGWDWRDISTQLNVPVLVFDGDLTGVAKNTTREWGTYLPNSKTFFLENSGHLTWLDNNPGFVDAVDTFLNGDWPSQAEPVDILYRDMMAHYTFEGSFQNSSDNHQHGIPSGKIKTRTDRHGDANGASEFSVGAKVTIPTPRWTPDAANWSWSAWVTTKSNNNRTILSHGSTASLSIEHSIATVNVGGLEIASSVPMSKNKNTWHHLVVVRDGAQVSLYQDGSLVASGSAADLPALEGDFIMENKKGGLDDVRIYSRSITQSDVDALHQN